MTGLYAIAERSDVEFHGQAVLAALSAGRFDMAHGQGVSDAAFSRGYGETRASSADKRDYALGYHLGRYLLFAGLPRWRSPVNPATARDTLEAFKLSMEGRKFAAIYGEPFPAIAKPDSQWLAQASSVLDVMEESAARAPGDIGKLSDYTTDSGLITCRALRSPFRFELALNGEPISRAHALELIAARMESRLS